jgi:outer membrane lipoprotein-sorting protein
MLLSGLTTFATSGFEPVENTGELLSKLNENALKTWSIQSNFIQKKQMEFLDETIMSTGKFWFKKEGSLRWEYKEPFEYVIVIHNGKFQIKDGDQVSAYDIESNAAFREINDVILGMVQGNIIEQGKFEIQALENDQQYLVKLVPIDNNVKEVISDMELYFEKADLMVSEIIMRENEKDYTVITFIDRRVNETIPEAVFTTDH